MEEDKGKREPLGHAHGPSERGRETRDRARVKKPAWEGGGMGDGWGEERRVYVCVEKERAPHLTPPSYPLSLSIYDPDTHTCISRAHVIAPQEERGSAHAHTHTWQRRRDSKKKKAKEGGRERVV